MKQQKIEASSQPYMYHGQLNGNMDVNIPQLSGKDVLALDGSVNLPEGSITKKSGTLISPVVIQLFMLERRLLPARATGKPVSLRWKN